MEGRVIGLVIGHCNGKEMTKMHSLSGVALNGTQGYFWKTKVKAPILLRTLGKTNPHLRAKPPIFYKITNHTPSTNL